MSPSAGVPGEEGEHRDAALPGQLPRREVGGALPPPTAPLPVQDGVEQRAGRGAGGLLQWGPGAGGRGGGGRGRVLLHRHHPLHRAEQDPPHDCQVRREIKRGN